VQQKGMSIFGAGVFCHSSPVTLQQSIRAKWITQQIILVAYIVILDMFYFNLQCYREILFELQQILLIIESTK
jgi:hypothetical protein